MSHLSVQMTLCYDVGEHLRNLCDFTFRNHSVGLSHLLAFLYFPVTIYKNFILILW